MKWPATVGAVRARPVQTRHKTDPTSKEYVTRKAWREARLHFCPAHPQGGCGFHRNGTYPRVAPAGMRIARYYCPKAKITYSLLPDCLASRLSGDLSAVEEVVAHVERSRSIEAAADRPRAPAVPPPSAARRGAAAGGTPNTKGGRPPLPGGGNRRFQSPESIRATRRRRP